MFSSICVQGKGILLLQFVIGLLSVTVTSADKQDSLIDAIDCAFLQPWDADENGFRPWSSCSEEDLSSESSSSLEESDESGEEEDELPFGVRIWGNDTKLVFDIQEDNPYITQNGTDPLSCDERDCSFTWKKDVKNHDHDIMIYYAMKDGWTIFNESNRMDKISLCDASRLKSGSFLYDAWKLLSYLIAGNVQTCPIHAGTYTIPQNFNFTFTSEELMPCSNDTRFDVHLISPDNPWFPWTVVRAINSVPNSFNCTDAL